MDLLNQISESIINADIEATRTMVEQALKQNLSAKDILNKGLISGMDIIGKQFADREIFLPDVLLSAKAMKSAIELLKPHLAGENIKPIGRIVIGTVQGDLHDIGKNLVGIMLQGAGFEVIDLGHDVPAERFVDTAVKENAGIIGLSALLTTTMPSMKKVIDILRERNLDYIKVIIGGAPVNDSYAKEIGADAYSFDAANAVEIVRKLAMKKNIIKYKYG
jgi:5-methyltetrahydrofolate--homocysteine methyltransferase